MSDPRRPTGLPVLGDATWGCHLSLLHETADDMLATVVPFLTAGLEANEHCLWLVTDPFTTEQACDALRPSVPHLERAIASQQLMVVRRAEMIARSLDREPEIASWLDRLQRALDRGVVGMRIVSQRSWRSGAGRRQQAEHEAELDRAIADRPLLVLCCYPLQDRAATDLLDVARNHDAVLTRRRGRWQVIGAPHGGTMSDEVTPHLGEDEPVTASNGGGSPSASPSDLLEGDPRRVRRPGEDRRRGVERRSADRGRARHARQLQEIANASVALGTLQTVDEVLRVATECARSIVGAHQAVISLTIDERGSQAVHTTSLSEKYAAYRGFEARPDGSGIYSLVVRFNRPLRLTQKELESHAAWRGFGDYAAQHPPMRGWIAVPLIGRDGRNLGLLQLSDKDDGEFSAADEAILVQLAQIASVALTNLRLLEQVQTARTRLQTLSRRLVVAQEEERRRIAHELHDEIGQALTALKLNLEAVRGPVADPAPLLADSIAVAERTLQQVRDLSLDLRPLLLDDLGLPAALRWYLDRQARRAGWEAHFNADPLDPRPSAEVETVCFRVAQEALTNAARHAGATHVRVELRCHDGGVLLSIADDGSGFDRTATRTRASLGLLGMQERVALAGGKLEVESAPGAGTTVIATLPLVTSDEAAGEEAR